MIVRFGMALDGKTPEQSETEIGHVNVGPQGFLSILETQLGQNKSYTKTYTITGKL